MTDQWKTAALGAFGGATIALVIVFGAARLDYFEDRSATQQAVREFLLDKPEMLQEMADALHDKQRRAEVDASQVAVDKQGLKHYFDPRVAFVTGPENAKTTVVEFFDYNCPYCRASLPAVKKFYEKHQRDTRFAFIEFPINGENSVLATRAMLAARRQPGKYVPFHFALMSEESEVNQAMIEQTAAKLGLDLGKLQADMNDPTIAQEIARVQLLANRSKITGTPTFIVNGKVRPGAVDEALLTEMLKRDDRG